MIELDVTMNFDLSKISLDFTKELNQFAKIIRADIFKGIETGVFDGKAFIPLKEATIKAKMRKKYKKPANPLLATGSMRRVNIDKATKENQEARIYPGEKRRYKGSNVTMSQVGKFHQEGMGNNPVREWFGISKEAKNRGLKIMEQKILSETRRA